MRVYVCLYACMHTRIYDMCMYVSLHRKFEESTWRSDTCVYVCMHVCMYVCIHLRNQLHLQYRLCILVHACMYVRDTYIHLCFKTHESYIQYTRIHIYTKIIPAHIRIHTYIHTCHCLTCSMDTSWKPSGTCACMYVCMYIRMYVCMHAWILAGSHRAPVYACMYVYMLCMCVYIYIVCIYVLNVCMRIFIVVYACMHGCMYAPVPLC